MVSERRSCRRLALLCVVMGVSTASAGSDRSVLGSARADDLVRRGIALTVAHRYQEAQACFDSLAAEAPGDPAGPFFQAALIHARMLEYETGQGREEFATLIRRATQLAQHRLAEEPGDARAYFFRGAALGYHAFHAAREGRYLTAWQDGQSSLRDLEMAVRLDSSLADAYLGIGSYKYWRGKLLRYLSWLPFVPEEREEGIRLIRLAIDRGRYSRLTGLSDLAWVLIDAGHLDAALECAHQGLALCEESRFFLWPVAEIYFRQGDYRNCVVWYERLLASLLSAPENNHYNEVICRLKLAHAYAKLGDQAMARLHAETILALPLEDQIRARSRKKLAQAKAILQRCEAAADPP